MIDKSGEKFPLLPGHSCVSLVLKTAVYTTVTLHSTAPNYSQVSSNGPLVCTNDCVRGSRGSGGRRARAAGVITAAGALTSSQDPELHWKQPGSDSCCVVLLAGSVEDKPCLHIWKNLTF